MLNQVVNNFWGPACICSLTHISDYLFLCHTCSSVAHLTLELKKESFFGSFNVGSGLKMQSPKVGGYS